MMMRCGVRPVRARETGARGAPHCCAGLAGSGLGIRGPHWVNRVRYEIRYEMALQRIEVVL